MKTYNTLTITIENAIATLTFNRPDVLNALSTEVVTEALDAAAQLEDDGRVRVI
ncbi:MAG: enoyl-CoA hydratase/isomerase family protein, partial [Deltaproteobacteria bacterium]|nr:enoyl-CoA hydratase/isomerase family protein [Deltaproteobacteria bacterium]